MDLTSDERSLLEYAHQWCPTSDATGAIAVGVNWSTGGGAAGAHTGNLRTRFRSDWERFKGAAHSLRDKGVIGLRESETVWELWPTAAGRLLAQPTPAPTGANPPSAAWERVSAVAAAFVVLSLVVFLAVRNEPIRDSNIAAMIRIVLSLAMAVFSATVPGFLNVDWRGTKGALRAGGALAVLVISYFATPKVFPTIQPPPPEVRLGSAIDPGNRTIPVGRDVALWVDNVPPNSIVTWSEPSRGKLNSSEGPSVRYTAAKPGNEVFAVEIRPPGGEAIRLPVAFRVRASLENLPVADANGKDDKDPARPRSQIVARGGVRNPLPEPVRIHGVTVRIGHLTPDPAFLPAFEMFPFLDYLVVRPVDRGWGTPPSGELTLFGSELAQEAGDRANRPTADIAKILDVRTKSLRLDASSWGRHHFLPQGPAAQPFSVVTANDSPAVPGPAGGAWRPRAFTPEPVTEMVPGTVMVTVAQQKGPAPGVVAVATGVIQADGSRALCAYRTRTFQPAPSPAQTQWLASLVGADTPGRIADGFSIATGDIAMVPVAQTVTQTLTFFGAELHLRDGTHREFRLPVARDVGGGGEFKYDVVLNTTKSLVVSGDVLLDFQVGDGPVERHESGRFEGTTRLLRPDPVGWDATEQFLKELRAFDPKVHERAVRALDRAQTAGPRAATLAERAQLVRQCRDAILVLLTAADAPSHRPRVLEFLRSEFGRSETTGLFPVVCAYFPDVAVPAAVAAIEESPGLIAQCVCRPDVASRLASHREAVERALTKGALSYPPTARVAVALLSDLPDRVWAESPDQPWRDEWAIAAWSLSRKANARLEAEVRKRMTDPAKGRDVAAMIIDGLAASGNERFRNEVAAVVEQTAESSAVSSTDYQALVSGLRYLARFRSRPGLRPLLTRLESYPYDGLVRDLAKQILDNPGTD